MCSTGGYARVHGSEREKKEVGENCKKHLEKIVVAAKISLKSAKSGSNMLGYT